MRIGIVDVDGHHFPNLALMKLSAWHKSEGDSVEFADAMFGSYDRVYMSKVFTFTPDCSDYYPCEVVKAGTGYRDYTTTLPESIEHMCPDYSLYGVDEAYGFLTRGCPNHCPWCIVPHKEGSIRPASPIRESSATSAGPYCSTTMCWHPISDWNRSRKSSAWVSRWTSTKGWMPGELVMTLTFSICCHG